jgi:hypothetical protein
MIATLCWKEYREQRGVWFAIVVLAVLIVVGVGSMANQGLWQLHQDTDVCLALAITMVSLVVVHGVVCGAQQVAGEKETGTLAFLDLLSPQRGPIWQTKFGMGCLLTVTQSQILAGLTAYFQLIDCPLLLLFPLFAAIGVYGLLCGMVGGAWCRQVLPAVLTGAALVLMGLAGLAAVLLWCVFRGTEKPRRHRKRRGLRFLIAGRFRRWLGPKLRWIKGNTCWWLSMKQGLWVVAAGLAASLAGGFLIMPAFFTFYPFASLAAGLLCGLAAFAPEQVGEQERFLGAQRFPPGQLWFHKSLFWLTAAAPMVVLLGWPGAVQHDRPMIGILESVFRPVLFAAIWPIYGFCFGQFFMLLSRRIVVAAVMAAFASLVVLLAWLPSMLFGGASTWQFLGVPLFLLLATRLSMWSWLCRRMYSRSHIVGLAGCALFVPVFLAGNFWYRAVEIPDVGEPFDIAAYEADLNRAARTGTASAIKSAVSQEETHRESLFAKFGSPTKRIFPVPVDKSGNNKKPPMDYMQVCREILENGWPKNDVEVGRWLDAMFEGAWAANLRKAANMPLGLMVDPRHITWETWHVTWETPLPEIKSCRTCATLFTARATQLQARGEHDASLEHLGLVLALSRQLRHHAISFPYLTGTQAQDSALTGYAHWLAKVGPDPKRLRKALEQLLRHEKETPDALESLKAQYIFNLHVSKKYPFGKVDFALEERIYAEASQVPWERERRVRLLNAVCLGQLTAAKWPRGKESHLDELARAENSNSPVRFALSHGLPLAEGPTTALSPGRWAEIILDTPGWWHTITGVNIVESAAENLRCLRAYQLVTALALYEVDKEKPAAKLDDLVPDYLATIPLDPVTGKPFSYRIAADDKALFTLSIASALGTLTAPNARGPLLAASALAAGRHEEIKGVFPPIPPNQPEEETVRVLVPGQGVILAEKEPKVGMREDSYYLVPRWRK